MFATAKPSSVLATSRFLVRPATCLPSGPTRGPRRKEEAMAKSDEKQVHVQFAERVLDELPADAKTDAELKPGKGAYTLLRVRGRSVASIRNRNARVTMPHAGGRPRPSGWRSWSWRPRPRRSRRRRRRRPTDRLRQARGPEGAGQRSGPFRVGRLSPWPAAAFSGCAAPRAAGRTSDRSIRPRRRCMRGEGAHLLPCENPHPGCVQLRGGRSSNNVATLVPPIG